MHDIRQQTIEGLSVGQKLSVSRTFTETDMRHFGDISRDYNPVHYDKRFAATKQFKDRICHGLLVAGMVTEIGGQIGWLASGMNFRFKKPVYFGDTVDCVLTITDIDGDGKARATAAYYNQNGEEVLSADLFGILPGERERRIMQTMVAEGDPTNKLTRS
jgi:acyl dehydratase